MSADAPEFWEPDGSAEADRRWRWLTSSGRASDRLPRAGKRHVEVLVFSALIIVLAGALQVLPDRQHVALRGLASYPLPHLCTARTWFGVKCPGCGLTRSIIYLTNGDWQASFQLHRLGWLMALIIVIQVPYRLLALRRMNRPLLGARTSQAIAYAIIGLLLGSWLFDLAHRPSQAPSEPDRRSNRVEAAVAVGKPGPLRSDDVRGARAPDG